MPRTITIDGQNIGPGQPTYIIAELSANHNQKYDESVKLIEAAKNSGANAVKLQTYTPETITIDCHNEYFKIKGSIWEGRNLYDLYKKAYTPWEWQPELKRIANEMGIHLFSSPFDGTAVAFLETMDVPAYKVASFELVDLPLLRIIAQTGKPVILSTGMASLAEIDEALSTLREAGAQQIALLKCTSAYPSPPEEMNLLTIPDMASRFDVPAGISDHTLEIAIPIAAMALGARIIEKHFTLSRSTPGPDSAFSLEPQEFKAMVDSVRKAEKALGSICYEVTQHEIVSRFHRRSIFVVKDMKAGDTFTSDNIRSIRPAHGLHTRYFDQIMNRVASKDIKRGTPLTWDLIK